MAMECTGEGGPVFRGGRWDIRCDGHYESGRTKAGNVGLKCASAVFEPLWLPPLPIVESSRRGRCSHGRCPESEYTVPCAASACPAATTTTTTITNHSDLLLLVFFFLRCHFSYFSLAVHHHAAICFEEGEKDGLGGGRVKDRWQGRVSKGGGDLVTCHRLRLLVRSMCISEACPAPVH